MGRALLYCVAGQVRKTSGRVGQSVLFASLWKLLVYRADTEVDIVLESEKSAAGAGVCRCGVPSPDRRQWRKSGNWEHRQRNYLQQYFYTSCRTASSVIWSGDLETREKGCSISDYKYTYIHIKTINERPWIWKRAWRCMWEFGGRKGKDGMM